ncbi:hypothetical protein DXG03_004379 [Asterophora parasitica]|uniref:C2H2-type domain-containing protein n=1 Tax=Asterophora parasitica TaxID=117018 RepID=A0A9P7KEQ9_9AGAR|nr:hypothetical protein DXG03_004379 [Asterophora parasitica]
MDDIQLQAEDGSPYINEIDLQPPSPRDPALDLFGFTPDFAEYTATGSPFSSHSDLSFSGDLGPLFPDRYDPTDFDNPQASGTLLMFGEYNTYYNSPSPSDDDQASSASSSNFVAHSFEALSFNSPSWPPESLPKDPSPPRLLMPDQPFVVINAPDDQEDLGPSLNIVPATPVDGGLVHPASRSPSPAHSQASGPAPSRSPSASPQPPSFLNFPSLPRSRCKSDTNLDPPNWDQILDPHAFSSQPQPYHPPTLGSNFSFGGAGASSSNSHSNNAFLSPEYPEFPIAANTNSASSQIRRAKSDAGSAAQINRHRASRSADYTFPSAQTDFLSSAQPPYLVPPSPHVDLLRQQQFLSPRIMSISHHGHGHGHSQSLSLSAHSSSTQQYPQTHRGGRQGHYRRASSGTRSERGSTWGAEEAAGGLSVGSSRPSPYPSPNASPNVRGRYAGLERPDEFDFTGLEVELGLVGGVGGGGLGAVGGEGGLLGAGLGEMAVVSKQNVTTGRTANASQKRRKQDANFMCPVPGCGSTFTRSFNLKGALLFSSPTSPYSSPTSPYSPSLPSPPPSFPLSSLSHTHANAPPPKQATSARTTKKNPSGASGPGAARALRGSTTASGTSSFIPTIDRLTVRGVGSSLLGWMRLIDIVSRSCSCDPSNSMLTVECAVKSDGGAECARLGVHPDPGSSMSPSPPSSESLPGSLYTSASRSPPANSEGVGVSGGGGSGGGGAIGSGRYSPLGQHKLEADAWGVGLSVAL